LRAKLYNEERSTQQLFQGATAVPLYEYQCKQCGHHFEKIQSFSAPEIKECPVCKGEVEKLISAPAFQFKGSGWYVSDYGKGGAAGSNTKPNTGAHGEGSGSGGDSSAGSGESVKSGDSKPAASGSSDSSGASSGATSGGSSSSAATPAASKKD
jgi:putative FmdB family regulatory protein